MDYAYHFPQQSRYKKEKRKQKQKLSVNSVETHQKILSVSWLHFGPSSPTESRTYRLCHNIYTCNKMKWVHSQSEYINIFGIQISTKKQLFNRKGQPAVSPNGRVRNSCSHSILLTANSSNYRNYRGFIYVQHLRWQRTRRTFGSTLSLSEGHLKSTSNKFYPNKPFDLVIGKFVVV